MPKFLGQALVLMRKMAKNHLPLIFELAARVIDLRLLGTSWAARLSRIWGARVLLAVGAGASVYAMVLFAVDGLGPGAPSPAHDAILRNRFSSPPPSVQVVIIDIDERSLAMLAPEHGRWPWPRSVMADGLQKLSDLGARGVMLNVLYSDPDKGNPDADAAMDATAAMTRNMAFPIVRLAPENDAKSQLKVAAIPGAQENAQGAGRTVAAVLPVFATMHDRLGVANQYTEGDGIVRKYALVWQDSGFTLPSLVGRTLEVGGAAAAPGAPDLMSLNWRNKEGSYQRIPFADMLQAKSDDPRLAALRGAWVVVGASAPGLGQTKPTSVKAVTDDNEILATALDDAISGTWLRVVPPWLTLLINLGAIWVLVALAMGTLRRGALTQVFLVAQTGFGAITLLSASYTPYLIDLSESMSFGAGVFGVIKIVQSLEAGWLRARPGMRRIDAKRDYEGTLAVAGFMASDLGEQDLKRLVRSLETIVGVSRIIRVDDLFGGESFLKKACADLDFLLVLADDAGHLQIDALLAQAPYVGHVSLDRQPLMLPWQPDDPALARALAPMVLESGAALLRARG